MTSPDPDSRLAAAAPAGSPEGGPSAPDRRDFLKWSTAAAAAAWLGASRAAAAPASAAAVPGAAPRRGGLPPPESRTAVNLLTAFAGESQARNRYAFFAEQAREEGYMQIAGIFEETAGHEHEHAARLFSFMKGGSREISAAFPYGVVGDTAENLKAGAEGERFEWETMYPSFAQTAREEGLNDIADCLLSIAEAEKYHEQRYLALLKNIQDGAVFKKPAPVAWRCAKCGYVHLGSEAPAACPVCRRPRAHFEVMAENY